MLVEKRVRVKRKTPVKGEEKERGSLAVKKIGLKNETGKDEETGRSWVDDLNLVVDPDMKAQEDMLKDARIIDYQIRDDIREWDLSGVSAEVDREEEKGRFTLDKVKVVGVDGVTEVDYDGTAFYDTDKEIVAEVSEDEMLKIEKNRYLEIKRNRKEYAILCESCGNTLECGKCKGRGKSSIFKRKCKKCRGSGRCPICAGDFMSECPQCRGAISGYATSCKHCGKTFRCPDCFIALPLKATRCIGCRREFKCPVCKGKVYINISDICTKCGKAI